MKKYILILGAGLMQRPAIEAARELGYKVLLVDANKNALCVSFADRFEPIDLKDREGLLKLAISEKENIAAIFTCGTDFSASVSPGYEPAGGAPRYDPKGQGICPSAGTPQTISRYRQI